MLIVLSGKWVDLQCALPQFYVCKGNQGTPKPTTPASAAAGFCPRGYTAYYNKCFQVFDQKLPWKNATKFCMQQGHGLTGFYLASLDNTVENGNDQKLFFLNILY